MYARNLQATNNLGMVAQDAGRSGSAESNVDQAMLMLGQVAVSQHSGACINAALHVLVVQVEVQNASDVVALMARGASQRATSETKMNDRSSRSHQILTVIVDGFNMVTKAASHGCLHLIDLAGSERVGKSEASGTKQNPL